MQEGSSWYVDKVVSNSVCNDEFDVTVSVL